MIILDTNQLHRALPGNPTLTLLTAAANRCGHTLAITDIVLREMVRQRREGLTQARKALQAAQREVNKYVRPASRIVSTAWWDRPTELEIDFFESELRQAFTVLHTDPEDALEALEREADRRSPCRANGEGGRDTAIYLTALRAARKKDDTESVQARIADKATGGGRPLPVIFVTEDKGFSDPKNRTTFSPELREEIADAPLTLRLDVVSALAEIGYPSQWVDAKSITERDDFRDKLRETVTRETLGMLSPTPHAAFPEHVRVRPPRLRRLGKAQQCKGGGLTLSMLTGTWSSGFVTRNRPDGLSPASIKSDYRLRITADITALVVQNESGEVIEADFSSTSVTITD
ncbi:PIN domain-containing protein [Streptomyces sp. NPDC048508]|uniref:PIN domain-containing protein n=1 Tax=Streptomyces sp. NPDC048508 TaxID=3365561 RepID=UPI0037189EA3